MTLLASESLDKVLLVLTTSGIFGDRLYQAFECPRRGRLRLKDLSSRWEDGVEAGVFFRLRAITCEPFFVFLENSENVWFWGMRLKPAPVPPVLLFVNLSLPPGRKKSK